MFTVGIVDWVGIQIAADLVGIQIAEQEKKNSLQCTIGKQDNEEVIELSYRISNATLVGNEMCRLKSL